jgi:hypothetical protein
VSDDILDHLCDTMNENDFMAAIAAKSDEYECLKGRVTTQFEKTSAIDFLVL